MGIAALLLKHFIKFEVNPLEVLVYIYNPIIVFNMFWSIYTNFKMYLKTSWISVYLINFIVGNKY